MRRSSSWDSHVLIGSCILAILLGGWNLHHSRDLRLFAKEIWGEWHFHLQLANGNNLWTTFFSAILLCSLLAQKENVLAILAAAVESAHPSALAPNTSTWAFCRWFPFSTFIHMIWMSFQMSLRMLFPSIWNTLKTVEAENWVRRCGELWAKDHPIHSWELLFFFSSDVQKLHAVVARSTFRSQNVQNASFPDLFWKLRYTKNARHCGAKHISKSKW